jgi:ABC-type antimicrobial peptide transport system permease subunit
MSDLTLAVISTIGSLLAGIVLGMLACWAMTTD